MRFLRYDTISFLLRFVVGCVNFDSFGVGVLVRYLRVEGGTGRLYSIDGATWRLRNIESFKQIQIATGLI